MDDLKNGLVFFDHLKKKTRELYRLRLVHERSDRFWFSNRYSFLSGFFFFSSLWCFMLVIIANSFFPLKHRTPFRKF